MTVYRSHPGIPETIERIGVAKSKELGNPVLFHRLKVKLSRKYRVWPIPGDDRSMVYDPSEFMQRFTVVKAYQPKEQP